MKNWAEINNEKRKEDYAEYIAYEINKSIKENRAIFRQDKKMDDWQRAYNPATGIPFSNLNSLILDTKQLEGKYKENAWISLEDARFLGVKEEEINTIKNNKTIPKALYTYIKTHELEYIHKLDDNGNKIPLLDDKGHQRTSPYTGELLYEYSMIPQRDLEGNINYKKNGEPFMAFETKRVEINPTLIVKSLYNVSEFKTLDFSRLKPLNQELKKDHFFKHSNNIPREKQIPSIALLEEYRVLKPDILKEIKSYFYAQNLEKNFKSSFQRKNANNNSSSRK